MSRKETDAERGIQKFVIRNPKQIDEAIKELAGSLPKNTMYISLLKAGLAEHGVFFDAYNNRFDKITPVEEIEFPMVVGNPVSVNGQYAVLEKFNVYGAAMVGYERAGGGYERKEVDIEELSPWRMQRKVTPTTAIRDNGASPVPKELL